MSFYVYMLRCRDYSYYVGQTDDIDRRLAEHKTGAFPGYTQQRRPVRLVFLEELATRDEALTLEQKLKGWSRAKKEALVMENWERLRLLSRSRGADVHRNGDQPGDGEAPERNPSSGSGIRMEERGRGVQT